MLIAEDLLLLLTDDTSGRLSALAAKVDILLAGANLVELALMGRVDISREVKPIRFLGIDRTVDRLVVRDPSPTGDAVLDAAVQIAIRARPGGRAARGAPSGEHLSWVIRQSGKNLPLTLYKRFVSSGMVRHERRKILAVVKVDRWPVQDSRHKVEVRQRVIQALVEQTTPDTRSAAMIAILHTIEHEPKIVDPRNYGISGANSSRVASRSPTATGRPRLFATRSTQSSPRPGNGRGRGEGGGG